MSANGAAARCPAAFGRGKSVTEAGSHVDEPSKKKVKAVAASISPPERQQDGSRQVPCGTQKKLRLTGGRPRDGMCVICREYEVHAQYYSHCQLIGISDEFLVKAAVAAM